MGKVFLFALTAALNPTLLTATTVMLLLPSPKKLMLGYLAGAMTTGIIVGIAIVEWLNDSHGVSTTKHTIAPSIDFALGVIALIGAWVIWRGHVERAAARRKAKKADKPKKTPLWQQKLSQGTPRTTYVIGLLLSFPGASYLASLTQIHQQGFGTVGVVLTVIAVNIVMLILLEAPLICFAVAPEWTPVAIERFKASMSRNGAKVATIALTFIGLALILRAVLAVV
ncbi:MAG TPA: GAP family protein [Gaiellaceae bacterium]